MLSFKFRVTLWVVAVEDLKWFGMLGYDAAGREEPVEELQSYIHPEDRPMVNHHYRNYIAVRSREPYEIEFRFRQARGGWCWVLSKGRAVEWDPDGVPSRLIGLDINIQTLKDAQAGMAQSEARFRSLFMMAPLPLVEIAADGRIVGINERFIQTLGYGLDEIPAVDQELGSRSNLATGEYQVTCKDAATRHMLIGACLIGESYLVSFVDITDWKRAEVERRKL